MWKTQGSDGRGPAGTSREPEMRACSACAGDYEDPDWTAWTADPDEDGDEEAQSGEFPVPAE